MLLVVEDLTNHERGRNSGTWRLGLLAESVKFITIFNANGFKEGKQLLFDGVGITPDVPDPRGLCGEFFASRVRCVHALFIW
jgi:hypothetical protein